MDKYKGKLKVTGHNFGESVDYLIEREDGKFLKTFRYKWTATLNRQDLHTTWTRHEVTACRCNFEMAKSLASQIRENERSKCDGYHGI